MPPKPKKEKSKKPVASKQTKKTTAPTGEVVLRQQPKVPYLGQRVKEDYLKRRSER